MTEHPTDGVTAADGSAAQPRPAADTGAGTGVDGDGGLGPDATAADQQLLRRAHEVGRLDLADRPDAFADLDSAIVDELRAIEDL